MDEERSKSPDLITLGMAKALDEYREEIAEEIREVIHHHAERQVWTNK
jgi:hypothetical protein